MLGAEIIPHSAFGEWVLMLVSRPIYSILAVLIALCFVITTVKKKFEEKNTEVGTPGRTWSFSFWKNSSPGFSFPGNESRPACSYTSTESNENEDLEEVKDRLREAELAVTNLKCELDFANKSKLKLQSSLDAIEREKMLSENEIQRLKLHGTLNTDSMRNDSADQLRAALEEKDSLSREIDCLRREERISQAMLQDQTSLIERMEMARAEVEALKSEMKGMKAERDMAVRLASQMMEKAKGVASRDSQQRQLVEELIDAELKKVRYEEEERSRQAQITEELSQEAIEEEEDQMQQQVEEEQTNECDEMSQASKEPDENENENETPPGEYNSLQMAGDAPINVHLTDYVFAQQEAQDSTTTTSTDSGSADDDVEGINRPVTTSPAFRAFYNAFPQREY